MRDVKPGYCKNPTVIFGYILVSNEPISHVEVSYDKNGESPFVSNESLSEVVHLRTHHDTPLFHSNEIVIPYELTQ